MADQLREECRQIILLYADEETQRNAALTGEHKDYVMLVLFMLRNEYKRLSASGEISFTPSSEIIAHLDSIRPW
jgi:hypothetical protein